MESICAFQYTLLFVPIKSVHITNYYHKNSGGISTSYNHLLEAANRHRRFVRLIVPGEREETENVGEFGKIYYVPARYSPIFDKRYRVMMPWQYMLKDSIIRRILLSEMPDMIEVIDKYTLSIIGPMIRTNNFKALGRPMVVHFSCERMDDNVGSFLSEGRFAKRLTRFMIGNYTLPGFDYHLANSVYTAQEFFDAVDKEKNPSRSGKLFNFLWRVFRAPRVSPGERIFVCNRGADIEQFSPERGSATKRREILARAELPEDAVILLYAGRISPEKNIGLLVDLMKTLADDQDNDFRLLVAGAGPKSDWLQEQADKRARGKIVQLGHLDKEELADYYANIDVFVHPNPREPFGIGPLEAMASGVPTLVPNGGGVLSYATNENSWIAEPTGMDFAGAVRNIIGDESLRRRKIEKAMEMTKDHTQEASMDHQLATYDMLYEDFQKRNDLFTDIKKARDFDFVNELFRSESQKL